MAEQIPASRPRRHWRVRQGGTGIILLLALLVTSAATVHIGPRRGGTIIATWGTTLTTIDPAYTYGAPDWPQNHAVFDGLLGMNTQPPYLTLVPHMAAALPTVSNDRRTYTFHLRHGLVFSNGDPVTAQDFVYSWERMLAPKTASPDTYLWVAVQGASDFAAPKSKLQHVSGFKVLDNYSLQVTLAAPYQAFLYVLATPSSFVVDPAVIKKYHVEHADIKTAGAAASIGSGPFVLKDWVAGQKMDYARNQRYYLGSGWPYADAVHIDLGVDASVGVLRIEKGQSDLLGDAIPSAQFASVIQSPKLSPLVAHGIDVGVYMVAMNVKVKPFDNLLVRRAVAYALSKERAIRFINGRGTPATGILPPNLPGFNGGIPEQYPYNPAKAKQLLAQAGSPNGFHTTLAVPPNGYEVRIGDAVLYDLKQVGIQATVKPVVAEGSAIPGIPMIVYHWLMDYPDPSDFVDGFTACSAAVAGGSNVGFYCNPKLDALATAARFMPFGPARVAAYKHIDQLFMQDAGTVPIFNDLLYYMHSARLQGFYISPTWFPFTLEQYWLSS